MPSRTCEAASSTPAAPYGSPAESTSVHDRLERAGVIGSAGVPVYRDVAGAVFAYLTLHTDGHGDPRGTVLRTLLDFVRKQRNDPNLDAQGRLVFQELEERIQREIDESDGRQ